MAMSEDSSCHISVMPGEVLAQLAPQPGQLMVDGTLGGAGHARSIVERLQPNGRLIALDRDPGPIAAATKSLAGLPVSIAQANFSELPAILEEIGCGKVDGILLDLGLSSDQLADEARGFSFLSEGPLDLRFDQEEGRSAAKILEQMPEERLADLIFEFGEERYSRRIARAVVAARREAPIKTAKALADLVARVVPRSRDTERIHPATRTFQALRIAVNDELGSLEKALREYPDCLKPGGRLAIITFHSLEDRRVKEAFRYDPRWTPLTKKPLVPSEEEIAANPRARSAKLRVAERTTSK